MPQKHREKVSAAMHSLERTLRELGYKTTRVRSGEVVLVTIPCSSLFAPNSIELKTKASGVLSQLLPYIRRSDNYKVIVAVRRQYGRRRVLRPPHRRPCQCCRRVSFSASNGNKDTGIIPYGLGAATNPWLRIRGCETVPQTGRVGCTVPTSTFIDKTRNR